MYGEIASNGLYLVSCFTRSRRMSLLPRIVRLRASQSSAALARAPILRRQPILSVPSAFASSSTAIQTLRSGPLLAVKSGVPQKRWASAAAARAAEEVDEGAEEVWPERVLPVLSEGDAKRLKRQRNVGMSVGVF
jgi:hypothetical protein